MVLVGIIGIVFVFLLLALGMPIAFVMAFVGFVGCCYLSSLEAGLLIMLLDIIDKFTCYSLALIPIFLLMGYIAYHSGISSGLFEFANSWFGRVRGGLAMATTMACAAFGAICGSGPATAGIMSVVALPEMTKRGYQPSLSCGAIALGCSLAGLIPPSIFLAVYGIATQQSIARLFIAGIIPGIIWMLILMATIAFLVRRNPALAPIGQPVSFKDKLSATWRGTPEVMFVFILLIAGLMFGWFTPTEAGGIGAFAVLMVTLARRSFSWKMLWASLAASTRGGAMIILLVMGAIVFGHFLTLTRIPIVLADWVSQVPVPPFAIMLLIFLVYFIGGFFIDGLALMLLTVPVFFPVVISLGYSPIWFGIVLEVLASVGGSTPPVGLAVYVISGAAKDIPIETIFGGIWPFVISTMVFFLGLILVFPQIVTWLPDLVFG